MSNVIEFKLKPVSKDATYDEVVQALNDIGDIERRLDVLRKELTERWLKLLKEQGRA